jgi:hypothetical protein
MPLPEGPTKWDRAGKLRKFERFEGDLGEAEQVPRFHYGLKCRYHQVDLKR